MTISIEIPFEIPNVLGIDFQENIFDELRQVSKSSKPISLQFKTSLNSLRPSVSEL
jgi:hypothetical protein